MALNRESRRKLQKKHKYVYSPEEFDKMSVLKQLSLVKRLAKLIRRNNAKDNN